MNQVPTSRAAERINALAWSYSETGDEQVRKDLLTALWGAPSMEGLSVDALLAALSKEPVGHDVTSILATCRWPTFWMAAWELVKTEPRVMYNIRAGANYLYPGDIPLPPEAADDLDMDVPPGYSIMETEEALAIRSERGEELEETLDLLNVAVETGQARGERKDWRLMYLAAAGNPDAGLDWLLGPAMESLKDSIVTTGWPHHCAYGWLEAATRATSNNPEAVKLMLTRAATPGRSRKGRFACEVLYRDLRAEVLHRLMFAGGDPEIRRANWQAVMASYPGLRVDTPPYARDMLNHTCARTWPEDTSIKALVAANWAYPTLSDPVSTTHDDLMFVPEHINSYVSSRLSGLKDAEETLRFAVAGSEGTLGEVVDAVCVALGRKVVLNPPGTPPKSVNNQH